MLTTGRAQVSYVSFERRMMGSNAHTVRVESSGSSKVVDFRRTYFVVL